MSKKKDIVEIVTTVIALVFGLILVVMLILKITGHSPSVDDLQNIFMGTIMALLVNIIYKLGKMESTLHNSSKQFSALAGNFKEHLRK